MGDMGEHIKQILPDIIQLRQQIHRYPELKYCEQATAKLIVNQLQAYGYQQIESGVGTTGIIAVLDSQKPGKTIALKSRPGCFTLARIDRATISLN